MAWYIQRDYDRSLFYSDPQLTEEGAEAIAAALSHRYDCDFLHFDDETMPKAERLALRQSWRERKGYLSAWRIATMPEQIGVKIERGIYRAAKDIHGDLIGSKSTEHVTSASNQSAATNAESVLEADARKFTSVIAQEPARFRAAADWLLDGFDAFAESAREAATPENPALPIVKWCIEKAATLLERVLKHENPQAYIGRHYDEDACRVALLTSLLLDPNTDRIAARFSILWPWQSEDFDCRETAGVFAIRCLPPASMPVYGPIRTRLMNDPLLAKFFQMDNGFGLEPRVRRWESLVKMAWKWLADDAQQHQSPPALGVQIPSERTCEATRRGEDAPGYAFACYVAHIAGIYQEVRRCVHEPTSATAVNLRTGERQPAGRDASWVRDISRIKGESADALNDLRGEIIRKARAGGYVDSARAELDSIEAAMSRLFDSSFDDSAKAIRNVQDALARAECRLWDEIDHAMPVPSMSDAAPIAEPESGMLSASELAKKYDVDRDALRKRLQRWRGSHMNGEWIEPDKSYRRPNSPKYLYRVDAVMPIIRQLQSASGASA